MPVERRGRDKNGLDPSLRGNDDRAVFAAIVRVLKWGAVKIDWIPAFTGMTTRRPSHQSIFGAGATRTDWIPAFAGMTTRRFSRQSSVVWRGALPAMKMAASDRPGQVCAELGGDPVVVLGKNDSTSLRYHGSVRAPGAAASAILGGAGNSASRFFSLTGSLLLANASCLAMMPFFTSSKRL